VEPPTRERMVQRGLNTWKQSGPTMPATRRATSYSGELISCCRRSCYEKLITLQNRRRSSRSAASAALPRLELTRGYSEVQGFIMT
jgi:hypothetical protein